MKCVLRALVHRHISSDNGNGINLHTGATQCHHQGNGVVGSGVCVYQEVAQGVLECWLLNAIRPAAAHEERELRWSAGQDITRNDHALHLAGAFAYGHQAIVAIDALHGILATIAIASVDLDSIVAYLLGHFGGE